MNYIQKLRQLLDRKNKRHLLLLMSFSIFVSVVEAVGISAIMPFIDIAINFEVIQTNKYYQCLFTFFGFKSEVNFAIFFGFVLVGFYIFRGVANGLYTYVMSHFAAKLYAQTSNRLFNTYLAMPYQVFTNKNSSYLTKTIITEASLISAVINAVLVIMSEALVIVFLYLLMLIASWKITLIFTFILMIKIIFLIQAVAKRIKVAGITRAKIQEKLYEIMNRTFGNFKQVKLQDKDRLQAISGDISIATNEYAKVQIKNEFLNAFPRLFLETSGFVLIVALLIVLLYLNKSNISYILPTLSLFILAMYRLLPSINRIVSSYNSLLYYHKSIDIIDEELKTPQENLQDQPITFNHQIELTNIDFSYQRKAVLEDISIIISKGEKVAFIGESGAGKSTLVDLIIGLYQPNKGTIKIDNTIVNKDNIQNWRSQIGYIPQQVYLFDGTIAENISFGRNLDSALLEEVLKQANIFDFLQTKDGINTLVGEGGIQLSGGQKQRVAIARALYGHPEILVLDEATSALDDKTEQKIMNEIYNISKDKTLIIIAHRLSTIQGCDKVYEIKQGTIKHANQ